jgi:serine/threonine protein phosphatase 1
MSRLLAISDIHGCADTFNELLFNSLKIVKSDKLVLLGDYIDRGAKSMEVIDLIMDLIEKGYDITPLAGNHEVMLLDALYDKSMLPMWLINNGLSTLESFSVVNVEEIEKKYLVFFTRLSYYEKIRDFYFVHAGFNENANDPLEDTFGMIWECRNSYSHPLFAGKTIIHGHRPKTPDFVRKMIASGSGTIPIDTGCVYTGSPGLGFLSALEVNSMNLISVMNIEKP